jgi:putative membrane protein
MKYAAFALTAGIAGFVPLAAAYAQTPTDAAFVRQAAMGNEQEIRDARLQLRSSSGPAVRAFAQRMISDHSLAMVQLRAAARNAHVMVPAAAMPQMHVVETSMQSGDAMRIAHDYFAMQVTDHERMLNLLRTEAVKGGSPSLKAYAQAQIPIVEHHLALAENGVEGNPAMHNGNHVTTSGSNGAGGAFGSQPGQGSPGVNGTPLPRASGPLPSSAASPSVNPTPTPVSSNPP